MERERERKKKFADNLSLITITLSITEGHKIRTNGGGKLDGGKNNKNDPRDWKRICNERKPDYDCNAKPRRFAGIITRLEC
jgi:hypothetical protein